MQHAVAMELQNIDNKWFMSLVFIYHFRITTNIICMFGEWYEWKRSEAGKKGQQMTSI